MTKSPRQHKILVSLSAPNSNKRQRMTPSLRESSEPWRGYWSATPRYCNSMLIPDSTAFDTCKKKFSLRHFVNTV